jgi:hypothetical protein
LNMDTAPRQGLTIHQFERLLRLYPPLFYREFSAEILTVYLQRLNEADQDSGVARFTIHLQEMIGLALSILKERWHEMRVQKEEKLASNDKISQDDDSGSAVLKRVGVSGAIPVWVIVWMLLTTGVFPAAAFLAPTLTIPFSWLYNLGAQAGLWRDVYTPMLEGLGDNTGIALGISAVQFFMLRKILPKPGVWFTATAAVIWLIGLTYWWLGAQDLIVSLGLYVVMLLVAGLALGLTQWRYARRSLSNAFWIIPINVLAAISSVLPSLASTYFPGVIQLTKFLPGILSGTGMWFLLKKSKFKPPPLPDK